MEADGTLKKNYDTLLLFVILVAAAWLRFYHLGDISFSNDELSALTRTRFDSFHELMEKGVKVDGHPALVQVMIWCVIHQFNDDVFTIRLLFALAGIVSVFFLFLLGKRWFGKTTGLLAAAALATLQFPLLYSQTARPYAIGLMFTILFAYAWTRLLFDERKNNGVTALYILSGMGCIYSHYFSFMAAGLIGLSGFFFLKKNTTARYIISNAIIAASFIPSIGIFRQQFGYEGIGGWLPPPDNHFFSRFIFYCFNESWIVTVLFLACPVISFLAFSQRRVWNKFHWLSLTWFVIPFLIGYAYSVWKAPVLQFSTLIFSFPFLLVFIFSFLPEEGIKKNILSLLTLMVLGLCGCSTVIEKKYFSTNHFGVFKELAEKTKAWDEKYGRENILKLFSLSNPEYINYYFRKLNHDPAISVYTDDEQQKYGVLQSIMDSSRAGYFIYAWTNASHAYETPEVIMEKFPVVEAQYNFFNSQITLFRKGNATDAGKLISETGFENSAWGNENDIKNGDAFHSGQYSQKLDKTVEYSVSHHFQSKDISMKPGEMLEAEVWFNTPDTVSTASLVISFTRNGNVVSYYAVPLKSFYTAAHRWTKALLFAAMPDENCEAAIYVWNPKHETFYIDDFRVSAKKKNTVYRPI